MKSRVVVLKTAPETVLEDYGRLMRMADYGRFIPKTGDVILKLNLSWTKFFPACSSPPWQVEGVIKTMMDDGYPPHRLLPAENKTVVTHPWAGARNNKWLPVFRKYGLAFTDLSSEEWTRYEFRGKFLRLPHIFPEGIEIPRMFIGKSVIHLPTMKTHGHTVTTGAVKNSFGGLLKEVRHYAHKHIHEVLVDLMIMQKELHPGVFAVMDGTVCGDGAGPRTMIPRVKNYILAGADSVALDAVAARMMGFDPMAVPYLRMCHDQGLGVADPRDIEVVGEDVSEIRFGFRTRRSFVIWGDQQLRKGCLRFLEKPLLHSPLFGWAPAASNFYHDILWYPLLGRRRVDAFFSTSWGKKFKE